MVLNRRGVFFSLSALFFVAVLLFIFTSDYKPTVVDTGVITVTTTNGFRERLETSHIHAIVRERTYATLYALSTDAHNRGIVLQLPADYSEAIMTRRYRGNAVPLMTLPEAFGNLSNASYDAGVNLSVAVTGISVRQIGAFQALYDLNYTYNLSSRDGTVRFTRSVNTYGTVFLVGIPDRYYNNASTARAWGEYLHVEPYRPASWNNSEFANMSTFRMYGTNNESPSLFGRLTGDLSPSPYGIEVTIPPNRNPTAAGPNLTSMDWQYFNNRAYSCTYSHAGIYPNLRLNLDTITQYNISGAVLAYGDPGLCPPAP